MNIKQKLTSPPRAQKGIVAIFATLAMTTLIGAAALALDVGNLVLSKGKLQNLADSAALSAAKTIALEGDHSEATAAGNQVIADNLQLDGFSTVSIKDTSIIFEFSETLPFDSSTATATSPYVRVRIENVDIPDFLVTIFDIDLNARASAVAGPSTSIEKACNIAPLSICEGSDKSTFSGYSDNSLHVLKASTSTDSSIGSGNFMPVALTDGEGNPLSGANSYAEALAGSFDACLNVEEDEPIWTEPGNMVVPSLGVDTRFGLYNGMFKNSSAKATYKPDIDTTYSNDYVKVQTQIQVDDDGITMTDADGNAISKYVADKAYSDMYHYGKYKAFYKNVDYESCLASSSCQNAGYYRRVISVPILKCDQAPKSGGKMKIPLKGLGCFFLIQPMSVTEHEDDKGGGGNGNWLIGEFLSECRINTGNPGINPDEDGPYKIVLFKDPDSGDS